MLGVSPDVDFVARRNVNFLRTVKYFLPHRVVSWCFPLSLRSSLKGRKLLCMNRRPIEIKLGVVHAIYPTLEKQNGCNRIYNYTNPTGIK